MIESLETNKESKYILGHCEKQLFSLVPETTDNDELHSRVRI